MSQKIQTILLVDDSDNFCKLFADFIDMYNEYKLIGIANNGIEAIEKFRQFRPDILILDNVMPFLDGIGVLEQLRKDNELHNTKIIMFTAFGQDAITKRANELGVDYFILKPFSLNILLDRIMQISKDDDYSVELDNMEKKKTVAVGEYLIMLRAPFRVVGYHYIRDALIMLLNEPEAKRISLTVDIYNKLAAANDTSIESIERAIRYAIKHIRSNCERQVLVNVFGNEIIDYRLTNYDFLVLSAQYLRQKLSG